MAAENYETSNGWPLGLQIVRTKLQLLSSAPAVEPRYSNLSSTSFSSVSSSNLDTESSASFFDDNSVSLGKLIGFRQHERGSVRYFQNTIRTEQSNWQPPSVAVSGDCEGVSRGNCGVSCGLGICIPVIVGSRVTIRRRKSKGDSACDN